MKKTTNQKLRFIIISGIILVSGLLIFFFISKDKNEDEKLVSFAKCLSQKGAVMYGAYWCPHCQNEKKNFGDAFKYINYVECTKNLNECLSLGIKGYPTWILNGKRLEGEQGLDKLAKESGCLLTEE